MKIYCSVSVILCDGMTQPSGPNLCLVVVVYFNAHNIADSQTNQHFHHHGRMTIVINILTLLNLLLPSILTIFGVIIVTATTDNRFAERNVLGKPMSRAIQNDIQNIQKMLDKDIEDSSLSGKTPKISLSLFSFSYKTFQVSTWLAIQSPPTCQNFA